MNAALTRLVGKRTRMFAVVTLVMLVAAVSSIDVLAHRVIGRGNALHTAFVQSPTASPVDLPIPIFNTGLSVICFRVTNTSANGARVGAIGLELPGELSGFSLVSPVNARLSIEEGVQGVPGFPGVTLDLVVRPRTGGQVLSGLTSTAPPVLVCVSGPFDTTKPIETLLNGVFVAFHGGAGSASDVGVWERRP
jgi:hypothetical protein